MLEVDSEKAKRGWVQRYLRLAASAANTSVAMCTMIEEQGLGRVLEGGGDSGEGGGLKELSRTIHMSLTQAPSPC